MSSSVPLVLFECFLLIHPVFTIVSRSYPGYVFSIPDPGTAGQFRQQTDAQIWCRNNGFNLLQIPNSQVQSYVVQFIGDVRSSSNGFSQSPIITNGMRSDQGWTWVNGKNIYSIGIGNQSLGLTQSFGFVYSNGNVMATLPTDKRNYICEGVSDCANGATVSGRCYVAIVEALSWFAARNKCLEQGGDLASFDFSTDNSMLRTSLEALGLNPSVGYWIGIRRQVWTWLPSNADVKYSQWSDGRPIYSQDNKCICLGPSDWKWIDCSCTQTYQFICFSVSNNSVTLPGSVTPSAAAATISPTATSPARTLTTLATSAVELKSTNNGFSLTYGQSLGLGLGLGIGVGLIIAAIIVIVYLRMTRCISSGSDDEKVLSRSSDLLTRNSEDKTGTTADGFGNYIHHTVNPTNDDGFGNYIHHTVNAVDDAEDTSSQTQT